MAAKTPLKDSLYKLLGKGSAPSDNGRAKAYVFDLLEEDAQVALALTMKPDEAVAFLLERKEKSESSLFLAPLPRSLNMTTIRQALVAADDRKGEIIAGKLTEAGVDCEKKSSALEFIEEDDVQLDVGEKMVLRAAKKQQGEIPASRSPPLHRLSSPYACQRIPEGASHELLGTSKGMTS